MHNSRAQKRHHFLRIKSRRIKKGYCGVRSQDGTINERHLGLSVTTPKTCKCWMCNHPRKVFGPSMGEIRELEAAKSQLADVDA